MHGRTSEAILCTLAAARDNALENISFDKITKSVVYGSDQTHSAFPRASKLVDIPPSNFWRLPTSFSTDFALCMDTVGQQWRRMLKLV